LNARAQNTVLDDSVVKGAPVVGYLFGGSGDITTTLRHVTLVGTYAGAESDNHKSTLVLSNTAIVAGGPDPETPDIELAPSSPGAVPVGLGELSDGARRDAGPVPRVRERR